MSLAASLRGIVSQRLVEKRDGGRVAGGRDPRRDRPDLRQDRERRRDARDRADHRRGRVLRHADVRPEPARHLQRGLDRPARGARRVDEPARPAPDDRAVHDAAGVASRPPPAEASRGRINRPSARPTARMAAVTAVPAAPGALLRAGLADAAAGAAPRRGRPPRLSGRRQRARRVPRPGAPRLRHRHRDRRPARRRSSGGARAGPTRSGSRASGSAPSAARRTASASRSRRSAPRSTAPTAASPRSRSPTTSRPTCRAATSRSTRWRSRSDEPELVDPHDGLADLAARRLRTPLVARDLVRGRPLRMLRAARFVATLGFEPDADARRTRSSRCTSGCRSSARSAIRDELSKLLRRRRSVGRALADRAHGARRRVPARAERDGARAGSDPPAQGRARAHDRGRGEDVAAPAAAARRAAARRRQAAARAATGRRA